jgi:hypothetical protein
LVKGDCELGEKGKLTTILDLRTTLNDTAILDLELPIINSCTLAVSMLNNERRNFRTIVKARGQCFEEPTEAFFDVEVLDSCLTLFG